MLVLIREQVLETSLVLDPFGDRELLLRLVIKFPLVILDFEQGPEACLGGETRHLD